MKLLSFLLNEIYSLWKQRNDDLHHRQDSREDADRRRHLKMQIRQLYAKENDVLGMYRIAFSVPLEERLLHSTRDLEMYLTVYRAMIIKGIQVTRQQTKHSHRPISDYFGAPKEGFKARPPKERH